MKLPRARPKVMGVPISIETVKGLTKASRDIFTRRFVSEDVKQTRQGICMECPSWNSKSNRCKECGCQMRIKTSLASSSCPLGKWGPLDMTNPSVDATQHEEGTEESSD